VSSGTIFDVWNVDNVVELIAKLVTSGWHHKYKNGVHYYVKLSLTSIIEKYKMTNDYIETIITRGPFPVSKTFVLEIPDDDNLQILWDTSKYGLFWHFVGDLLQLGFDYLIEQFEMQVDSIIYLLSLIGIDVYEILEDILGWLNKEKADEYKNKFRENFDDLSEDLKDIFSNSDILNSISEFDKLFSKSSSNNLNTEFNRIWPLNLDEFHLDEDFTDEDYIENIANAGLLTGLNYEPSDLLELYDGIEEIIQNEYAETIWANIEQRYDPAVNFNFNEAEGLFNIILDIMNGWNSIDDIKLSELSEIYNLQISEFLPEVSELNLNYGLEVILDEILDEDELLLFLGDWIIEFMAACDITFPFKTDFEIGLTLSWILLLAMQFGMDSYDYLENLGYGIWDDIIILVLAAIGGLFALAALQDAETDYQKKVASYYVNSCFDIWLSAGIEVIIEEILCKRFLNMDDNSADNWGDIGGIIADIILTAIGAVQTYYDFEGYDENYQWGWAILDGAFGTSNILWFFAERSKNYYFMAGVAGAQAVCLVILLVIIYNC
jgi:hypothetical protein